MYNTDDHWKQWGEQDPYFAGLSHKKFRKENIENNRKEFFESGAEFVSCEVGMQIRHRLPPVERFVYMVKQSLPFTRYCFNLLQARRLSEPLMQMNEYDLIEIMALGSVNGIREFALHPNRLRGTLSVILVGRKDA